MAKWGKGQSGNPRGRAAEKPFLDALRVALKEECQNGSGHTNLRVITDQLVTFAVLGEAWAIRYVMDRVDGKPAQAIDVNHQDKRDATDWTRDELVAFLNDARTRSQRAPEAGGSEPTSDSVH